MDGKHSKKINGQPSHGLRLVKGQASSTKSISDSSASPKTSKSPLIKQLAALADAIDSDVKQLLNL